MQRVVRSTLLGLLTIAGLTACGDKVTVPGVTTSPVSTVVRGVTVSPATATLNIGDKIALAASVNADAGVTDRTVTWASSNTAIASVDANGLVTAVAAGNATITATSKADATVKGAAIVTVNAAQGGGTNNGTIVLSNVNQTKCDINGGCTSVPANLGAVAGQIDVTVNADPGSAKLLGVDLILNCTGAGNSGTDTVVVSQNIASASQAPAASEASAPITLSFNTATFNSATGATAFRNGSCTLKARERTSAGTVTSTGQAVTLANADVVIGSISSTASAVRPSTGLLWQGGNITVSATPVMYSGRVPATVSITFEGKTQSLTAGAGTVSATFTNGGNANNGGATDIYGITDPAAAATFTLVDAAGQPFTTNPCGAASLCTSASVLAGAAAATPAIRLDTQKPPAGTIALANNNDQVTGPNGYVGAGFRFASDSAAGYRGPNAVAGNQTANNDNGGVDAVTVTFLQGTCGTCSSASTFTAVTNTSALSETNTSTANVLIQITKDALGNTDTSYANGAPFVSNGSTAPGAARFGVDKTAPAMTLTAGPTNQTASNTIGGAGQYSFTITDNLSGPNPKQLVAQTLLNSGISTATFAAPAENTIYTNGTENAAGPCVIGRWNATLAAAGANALPAYARDGTIVGYCTPVPYTLTGGSNISSNFSGLSGYATTEVIAVDQAGNRTAPFLSTVVEDATNPTVNNIDMPATLTGNATASFPASVSDNVDIVGSYGVVNYATPTNGAGAISLQYPTVAGPGVAFDNVLTRSATATAAIPNFIKNLQVSNGGTATAPAAGGNATSVTVTGVDEVNRQGSLTVTFANSGTQLVGGNANGTTWSSSTFNSGFFTSNATAATVSDCPTAGCAGGAATANPTSSTMTFTAAGTTGTFNNPFSGVVQVFYQVGGAGPWFYAGNAAAGVARDNGVTRYWDYTFTFTPPKTTPNGTSLTAAGTTNISVMAIGSNNNGDGIATAPFAITLTNP